MMFKIREACEADFEKIVPKKIFASEIPDVRQMPLRDPAWTVLDGSLVLGIFGVRTHFNGVGSLWGITSDAMMNYGPDLTKGLKKFLGDGARACEIHRLDLTVKADYAQGIRWAKVLGFEHEAVLRQYGPDKADYVQMVRFF